MTDVVNATLAALGVLAQVTIVVMIVAIVAALVSPRARAALAGPRAVIQAHGLWLAWIVAATATLGSLFFSEVADFIPCVLCWYQRIAMYPLAVILLVGAILKERRTFWYAIPFAVIGPLISARHIYIEYNPEAETAACRQGAPCSTKWIDEFGYVTIPVLAGTAFVLIGLILAVYHFGRPAAAGPSEPAEREEQGAAV